MSTQYLVEDEHGPLDSLRQRLVAELRSRLVDQSVSMPLGNQAALARVASLCRDPDASQSAIAAEAALDEGFTAMLLRMANSAALGTSVRVDDVGGAVTRLGRSFVECLAIAAPGLRLLATPADGLEHARGSLHGHAVRTAVLARMLAPEETAPDRALTAGLVHNLGLSVLSINARSGFRKLLENAAEGEQLPALERRLFGFTHADLGADLGAAWSYPPSLVTVIREHSQPRPSTGLAAVVQIADLLVRDAGFGIEAPEEIDPDVAEIAGIDLDRARLLAAGLLSGDKESEERMQQEFGFETSLIEAFTALG